MTGFLCTLGNDMQNFVWQSTVWRGFCGIISRIAISCLLLTLGLCGQDDSEIAKWMVMELEELSQVRLVSVAVGKKDLSVRESPGIVTLISAADIENSGARDLIDLLRLVPGFDFAVDVESSIGLGIRGNWAHEGRVTILLDGQELNELHYATFPFGFHIPLQQIERIEIIRGPGSSIYCGFAELAVVKIVSKCHPGDELFDISMDYGLMSRTYARKSLNLTARRKLAGLDLSLALFVGQAKRSQADYRDLFGASYSMKDHSSVQNSFLNLGLEYRRLKVRYIMDLYGYWLQDDYREIRDDPIRYSFDAHYLDVSYEQPIGATMKLSPRINYSSQYPYNSTGAEAQGEDFYKVRVERMKFSLTFSGDVSKSLFINSSFSAHADRGTVLGDTDPAYYFLGARTVDYSGHAFFIQTFYKTPLLIFSTGLRYDHHNLYGDSLVPWIGLNKVYDKLYFKFLFGRTTRVPSIANINLGRGIETEKSTEFDIEVGYQVNNNVNFNVNLFSTGIRNAIVYGVDPDTEAEFYDNSGRTGTWGVELESLLKGSWGNLNANYSFYRASSRKMADFSVPGEPSLFLGFPAHKLTVGASFVVKPGVRVNPTLVYYSRRYGYADSHAQGDPPITAFSPVILANVYLKIDKLIRNVELGLGVYNVFDCNCPFIQPYRGGHAPLPAGSREFALKLVYRLD